MNIPLKTFVMTLAAFMICAILASTVVNAYSVTTKSPYGTSYKVAVRHCDIVETSRVNTYGFSDWQKDDSIINSAVSVDFDGDGKLESWMCDSMSGGNPGKSLYHFNENNEVAYYLKPDHWYQPFDTNQVKALTPEQINGKKAYVVDLGARTYDAKGFWWSKMDDKRQLMAVVPNEAKSYWYSSRYWPEAAYISYHVWLQNQYEQDETSSKRYYKRAKETTNIENYGGQRNREYGRGYWCEVEEYPLVKYAGLSDGIGGVGRETYEYKDKNGKTLYTYKAAAAEITSPNDGEKFAEDDAVIAVAEAAGLDYISKYTWYLDGKAQKVKGGNLGKHIIESHDFGKLSSGKHTIAFEAENNKGFKMRYTITVTVVEKVNKAPVAKAGDDQVVTPNTTVQFDGTSSYDSDGAVTRYDWEFADGATRDSEYVVLGKGIGALHTTPEGYNILLTSIGIDNSNRYSANIVVTSPTGQKQTDLLMTNHDIYAPRDLLSFFNGNVVIWLLDVDMGKQQASLFISTAKPTHSYATSGIYDAKLTVTDRGALTGVDTARITVDAQSPTITITNPLNGATVNGTVLITADASDDAGVARVEFYIDYNVAVQDTTAPYEYSWDTTTFVTGPHVIRAVVYDTVGNTANDNIVVTVGAPPANQPPTANAGSDQTVNVNDTVNFDGSASSDSDGTIVSYSWDFGDGSANGTGATSTHTYTTANTYTITLTVTDDDGATDTDTMTVTVVPIGANQPPVANAGSDQTVNVNDNVQFDGSSSFDNDGVISTYLWNFGDGSTQQTGAIQNHVYTSAGVYTVTLTVTDDDGATGTDTAIITVNTLGPQNQAPVADAGSSMSAYVNNIVSFDGSASSDSDGTIASYNWNFGDGASGTGATPTHIYTAAGTYTVTLTVTDNDGATDTDTVTVQIVSSGANLPPVADAGNDLTATEGTTIQFDGTNSVDPDGSISTYSWNFGDSSVGTGMTPTHIYPNAGTYNVILTVTDNDGATDTDTMQVIITSGSQQGVPIAYAGLNKVVPANATVSFHGYGYDADGTISEHFWDFGDNTTTYGQTVTHIYNNTGTYTVTFRVTDNDGLSDTDTLKVTVTKALELIDQIELGNSTVKGDTEVFVRVLANATQVNVTINGTEYALEEIEDHVFEGNITAPSDEGIYNVTIKAKRAEYTETVTVNLTVDNTPTVILSIEPKPDDEITTDYVTLKVTTDENAVCRYSTTTVAFEDMTEFSTTGEKEHTTTVLTTSGENRFYVLCEDEVGNVMDSYQEIKFTGPEPELPEGEWTGITGLAGLNLLDSFVAGAIVLTALIAGSFLCFVKRREIFTRFLE